MADLLAQSFRATNGLDAGNNKIINVALADRTSPTDGASVAYVTQENTIQQYDSTRGYPINFAVIYNQRIWVSTSAITSPAGTFDQTKWSNTRTDPKWVYVNTGTTTLSAGSFVNADSRSTALTFTLPNNPDDGDNITLRDIGGNPGNLAITINASNQSIVLSGSQYRTYNITVPYSTLTFTFSNRLWELSISRPSTHNTVLLNSAQNVSSQAGDRLIPSGAGTFSFNLPSIVNDRDEISLVDVYNVIPLQHVTVNAPTGMYIGSSGKTSVTLRESGPYTFSYSSDSKVWYVINIDGKVRGGLITSDATLVPNQYAVVQSADGTTGTINLTLPTKSAVGDFVHLSLRKMSAGQTVVIKAATGDVILDSTALIEFPVRSGYPKSTVSNTSITINGTTNYPGTYHLMYTENTSGSTTIGQWTFVEVIPTVEQVDSSSVANRARLGVIALATPTQALVDLENTPSTNTAITPELLANRTATETRRGIARIATQAEVSQLTTATYDDTIFVTPKKLNARSATETMSGLAEIATQTETNAGTDDTTIITPKKLQARQATATMSGIAALVVEGGVAPSDSSPRGTTGTGVYNSQDYANIVTPRTLGDLVATVSAQGSVYLATQNEVIAGTVAPQDSPIVVTPEQLQKKTATESRIGFTQTATQALTNAGADDFTYITPLKLQNRTASLTMTGIAKLATQAQFDSGLTDTTDIVTPSNIAQYFTWDRTSVTAASGLTQSGNLWGTLAFDIQSASETQRGTLAIATQNIVNAGTDDTTVVTPKKLQAKVATESVLGIVQFATAAQTTAGTSNSLAISPVNILNSFSVDSAWQATSSFRGTVKMSTAAQTWVGDTTHGSTGAPSTYVSDGYAVNPMQLNTVLVNYLPKTAQAVDSALLGGIAPSSWVRRDISQTLTGTMTFTSPVTISNSLNVSNDIEVSGNLDVGNVSARGYLFSSSGFADEFIPSTQGVYIGWNDPSGQGNAVFFNAQGGGGGGYDFYNTDSASSSPSNTKLLHISSNGNLISTGLVQGSAFADSNGHYVAQYTNSIFYISNINTPTSIQTSDANTLKVNDAAGLNYRIVNEKNMNTILDPIYVNSVGDTMTGRLTVSNASTSLNGNPSWAALTQPTDDSKGYWSIEVTDSATYNTLPGYAVPVTETDPVSGNSYVASYSYINAPGTLSQFGVGTSYTYQIWTPRAASAASGALAQTFWIRMYNPITSDFDQWGRMYTTNNPPTAGEIGATSTVGTTVKNLTVTDWFKIGNIKIYPDTTTKTVKFEWIDD